VTESIKSLQIATQLNTPLTVPVQASLIKLLLIFVPHLLAIVFVIIFVTLSWFILLFIIALIGFSLFYYVRLHLWQNLNKSVVEVHQDSTKNWTIVCANQDEKEPVKLQANSFISPLIVILNFKGLNNKAYSALFVPDSLPETDFRRLRVRIRVKGLSFEAD